jgi:dihydropyrimidinase
MTGGPSRVADLVIRGGEVFGEDGTTKQADVVINGGLISSFSQNRVEARHVIDAAGKLVLPGIIDAHTHLNSVWPFQGERRPADDFETGTRSALAGGVTTVCDFVYPLKGETLRQAIDRVSRDAHDKSHIDFAFHIVITTLEEGFLSELAEIVRDGFPSFKFYTQLPDFHAHGSEYIRVLASLAELGATAMFHCEDASIIDYCHDLLIESGRTAPRYYPESKPREVEVGATAQALNYASVAGVRTYIVHLSAATALEQARLARAGGQVVFVETRPLYLYLTDVKFQADEAIAARYVGTPPLRTEKDMAALWEGLASGEIDVVASDHVGFTSTQKYQLGDTFETVPKGVANLETIGPMLYSEGVRTGRLTLKRFVDLVSTNPAKIFGLYPQKGVLRVGSDADFCVFDPSDLRTLAASTLHSAADWELFEGVEVHGWPKYTISRGEVIYDGKEILSTSGRGQLVRGAAHNQALAG